MNVVVLSLIVFAGTCFSAVRAGPEDRRLDPAAFRKGLKERGLTELLELYLREMPPADPVEALLLERDIRLAQYADPALPHAQRRDALLEANRLLERLIEEHPEDLRVFEWQIELGRALLYQEAELFYSRILYHLRCHYKALYIRRWKLEFELSHRSLTDSSQRPGPCFFFVCLLRYFPQALI